MHRILYLVPNLEYSGATRRLALLAAGLPPSEFDVRVAVLGTCGPVGRELQAAGIRVEVLGWQRLFDLNPLWRLRQLMHSYRPAVTQVWGSSCLRAFWLVTGRQRGGLTVSRGADTTKRGRCLGWLDRRALGSADYGVASNAGEAEAFCFRGLPAAKVKVIPPGVALASPPFPPTHCLRQMLGLEENSRIIACAGPLEAHKGHLDAIWALDILKYLYPELHLVLIGEGSERSRLHYFVRSIKATASVHFIGRQADVQSLLAQADVVWVPSRRSGGSTVTLEAMAAARAVVATRVPGVAELIVEGETGFLVPAGDKVALARQTRLLLDDAERRQRMGELARKRAESQFSALALIEQTALLFRELARR